MTASLSHASRILGYAAGGRPIFSAAGGAAITITDWMPIGYSSEVIQRIQMGSAIEMHGVREPMSTKTKSIPRSAGVTVTAGTSYTDDASTNDEITLTARRFMARVQIDEDDLDDALADVVAAKGRDWAISYADTFDNACLGVSAAANGTTAPFTSAYKTLRTSESDIGYTADDNYLTWDDDLINIPSTPLGTSLYEKLSALFKKVEVGKYWSKADEIVIAAPGWREALRNCTDTQGRPIFAAGRPGAVGVPGTPDTLFDAPIAWSRGCKVSGSLSGSPTGNDLLYYGNRQFLRRGDRTNPEVRTDAARAQDDTDTMAIKFRVRRAFLLSHPAAFSVLERVTD